MVMVTGGMHQGKTDYVIKNYNINKDDIADGKCCKPEAAINARCIKNYHELVKQLGSDCISFTERLVASNKDIIIIMDEIGCGIVPMEKSQRIWRENVGRCGCIIAANSEVVVRMVCGIPTVIKEGKS